MNQLVIIAAFLTVTSAAKLPSATYLPPGSGSAGATSGAGLGLPSAAKPPSATYIPQGSGPAGFGPSGQGSGTNNIGPQGSGNTRPQQAADKNSAILKLDQEVNEDGFHYAYETSNGIQAEEAGNAAQTRGGFAYKGDDGQIYSVTFTAGEDGFRPQGAHLPVPPPTPEDILLALKQNERDEAAGIFDDGQYHSENNAQGNPGKPGQGSSGSGFGSANHQGSFSSNSGYSY